MIYKLNNGGVVKLQNAWTTMPSVEDAILRAWSNQSAKEKAEKQVASEKPKYTYVNPYDYLHGWREATEDAAKQDKYTVENLGGSKEEAEAAYNATKENAAKQLAGTTATGLGTVALLGLSSGAAGPVAADIVNTGFGAHGLYNALSGNGIQKTVRLANQGDTWGTVKSGAGDLLDLSMGLHAAKLWGNLGKSMLAGQSLGNAYRGNIAGRELSNGVKRLTIPVTDLQHNIEAGKIGWAPAATKTLWHNSNDPVSELKINFPAWDVTERKAPLGHVWLTGNETTQGFLAKRPHHLKGKVELNKPMVQIGEAIGDGKNATRNQILDFAQKSSADGINFQGIADNALQNQDVYAVFKDVNIKPKLTEAERLGIPKGQRNSKIKESVLNWSWQDWFMDRINGVGHIKPNDFDKQSLYRHIPEYRQIEIATKRDGTWLKMPDGSIFEGDPREWVMAQSKAAQGLNFNNYYKLGSGQKPGYTIYFESQRNAPTMIDEIKGNFEGTPGRSAWLTDFEHAKGFANDGRGIGYTYKVYPQKDVTKANFDLQGLDWDSIPVDIVKELNIPESNGFISTNRIVSESPAQIIHLNNVAEGSGGIQNLVNDVIIKGKRKSILGNNGNFDWNDEIIWRKQGGILKAQRGTGLAGIPIIGNLAKKAAYKIVTNPDVAYAGGATPKTIVKDRK